MKSTVRTARVDDVHRIVQIYIESWNAGFGKLMPTREVTSTVVSRWTEDVSKPSPHRWWVAEVDSSIVGFVGICPSRDPIDPTIGEVDTIAVDPVWWRTGIGRELMLVALKNLRSDGYREAVLWTLTNYPRGQGFYQAMRWTPDGGKRDDGRQIRYRHDL